MGHGVHDAISEHGQKLSPNCNSELVDVKKDQQLVQSCKLWLNTRRQVNVVCLIVSAEGDEEEDASACSVARLNVGKLQANLLDQSS